MTRELLALLLLERDRLVPAERLMDVFWPHLAPTAAANNLQGIVLKLRRSLEPGLRRGRDSRYLVTEGEGYRLLTAGCRVDLDEFAQAAQAGEAALRDDDLPAGRAALQSARDLYRGELLSDMPYAEWAFPARERLREAQLEVLEALGQTCLRLGEYEEGPGRGAARPGRRSPARVVRPAADGGQSGPRRARRGAGGLRRLPAPAERGAGRRALRGDARAARGDPDRRRRAGIAGGSAHVGRAAARGPGRHPRGPGACPAGRWRSRPAVWRGRPGQDPSAGRVHGRAGNRHLLEPGARRPATLRGRAGPLRGVSPARAPGR